LGLSFDIPLIALTVLFLRLSALLLSALSSSFSASSSHDFSTLHAYALPNCAAAACLSLRLQLALDFAFFIFELSTAIFLSCLLLLHLLVVLTFLITAILFNLKVIQLSRLSILISALLSSYFSIFNLPFSFSNVCFSSTNLRTRALRDQCCSFLIAFIAKWKQFARSTGIIEMHSLICAYKKHL
jgi:uncharacterized membrane protein